MWVVLFVFAGAAVGLFWPRSRHSLPATAGLVVLAVATATALWGLVRHTANLPRSGTPVADQRELLYQGIAVDHDRALMAAGESLVRLDLKSGVIVDSFTGKLGPVLTSASSNGELTLLTYHDGPDKGGWALLGADDWIVPPHFTGPGGEVTRGHWDADLGRFALTTPFYDPDVPPVANQEPGLDDVDKMLMHSVRFEYVNTKGEVSAGGVMRIKSPIDIGGLQGVCRKGSRLAADFMGEDYCFLQATEESSTYLCVEPGDEEWGLLACPEHIPSVFQHRGWITAAGPELLPEPPSQLVGTAPLASRYSVRFGPEGPRGDVSFWTTESGFLVPVANGFVAVSLVEDEAASELGHVEWETRVDFLDPAGAVRESRFVRTFGPAGFVFANGPEVVLIDHSATEIARFSADTFERIDDPGAVTAVLDRLRVWGGVSHTFELLLAYSLFGMVCLLGFIPVELARRRGRERFLTVQRLSLIYLIVALPILAETIETIWHL